MPSHPKQFVFLDIRTGYRNYGLQLSLGRFVVNTRPWHA